MAGSAPIKWTSLTLFGILLQSIGLYFFVMGFFPVKPALKGNSGMESLKFDCSLEHVVDSKESSHSYLEKLEVQPQFDRVVLMVIDGLPAEFLLGRDGRSPSVEITAAMPFTQKLLSSRKAMGFHARAAPPTVTMPRLKAMTSGAIAGFLDVAFNFNTQAMLDDNLIGQLERVGWKMTMYGDDTWLRLFPKSFVRKDGVSSFFVKDTVQVDHNVSRHLREELARHDWDLLILHYLGLDHVGHLGGRSSSLMAQKLQEMDGVIKQLHASLLEDGTKVFDRETLLVVVSDHGMTRGGNHGGASYEETDALALFVRKRIFSDPNIDKAFQVDLVPTLALLLGVPIPKNSVGVLLPQLFDTLSAVERLRVLEVNSWQIMKLLKVRFPKARCISSICSGKAFMNKNNGDGEIAEFCHLFSTAKSLHDSWRKSFHNRRNVSRTSADWEVVSKAYLVFLRAASDWLARGSTEKNTCLIFNGGVVIFLSAVLFLGISLSINSEVCNFSKSKGLWRFKPINWIAFVGVCGHALSFNSSSLVEEEQFTLHFFLVTLWFLLLRGICQKWSCQTVEHHSYKLWCNLLPSSSRYLNQGNIDALKESNSSTCPRTLLIQAFAALVVLISARLLRGWHRGGVNWAHLPDIAKWLEQSGESALLASHVVSLALVVIACCWLVLEQRPHILMQRIVAGVFLVAAFLIELYNLRTHGGTVGHSDQCSVTIAQLVYVILGGTTFTALLLSPLSFKTRTKHKTMALPEKSSSKDWHTCVNFIGKVSISCWCLLQLLLQQPVNSGPVLLLLIQLICCLVFFNLSSLTLDLWLKLLMLYLMGSLGHFGMGNTNTLATVDVAGAYIGLSQHSIFLSGLLAFFITYAAPLLYMLGVLLMISLNEVDASVEGIHGSRGQCLLEAIALSCSIPLLLSSVILLSFTLVMLLMQGHLFVWSVFSPKYIYVCFTVLSTYWGVILNSMASLYTYIMV